MERIMLGLLAMVTVEPGLAQAALLQPAEPARFERLFVEHYSWVWRTLRRLGVQPGAVDDAAQHVFLTASQRLGLVPPDKERAFLMGVAVRTASNARRTQTRRREEPAADEEPAAEPGSTPEDLLDWKQRREKLDEWLSALTLELRTPFVLFELEGLSLVEIAELLDLPLGTVKTRLRRARAVFVEVAALGGDP
jgi:RNA polymerase sigma-70 factor, ECF subfamily